MADLSYITPSSMAKFFLSTSEGLVFAINNSRLVMRDNAPVEMSQSNAKSNIYRNNEGFIADGDSQFNGQHFETLPQYKDKEGWEIGMEAGFDKQYFRSLLTAYDKQYTQDLHSWIDYGHIDMEAESGHTIVYSKYYRYEFHFDSDETSMAVCNYEYEYTERFIISKINERFHLCRGNVSAEIAGKCSSVKSARKVLN